VATGVSFYALEGGTSDYYPRLEVDCALYEPALPADQGQADLDQAAGLARLRQNSSLSPTVELENGAVRFALFRLPIPGDQRGSPVDSAWWFLNEYSDLLRLPNPQAQLQFAGYSDDHANLSFRGLHNGIPVYPAELTVHLDGSDVVGVNGRYIPSVTLPPTPRLDALHAETLALAKSSPGAALAGDTQLRYVNLGLLGYPDTSTHLAWQVNVADPVLGGRSLFMDANTGAHLHTRSYVFDAYDLDIETANGFGPDPIACYFFTTSDDQWFDENGPAAGFPDPQPPTPDAEGNAAFASMNAIDQFWRAQLGRDGYDDAGRRYTLMLHAGAPGTFLNAWYTSWCDFWEFGDGMSTRDVIAHEITHGVIEKEGGLIYETQSGALNESLADIMSHMVDTDDWTIGEGTPLGAIRDLSNPPAFSDPDHMSSAVSGDGVGLRVLPAGTAPDCGASGNDCGFVHTNSGIHNKVGFLLMQGGFFNTRTITALGVTKVARLYYNVINNRRLPSSAQFIDARNAALAEALSLASTGAFGFTSNNACQVRNAYAAVGLGEGDADCDGTGDNTESDNDNDGVPDTTDNCVNIANGGQANVDGDGLGDACDPDADNDGVPNASDNCRLVANAGQADGNSNGVGDACDDRDGDGVMDSRDNCVNTANSNQRDQDYDGTGDACDNDRDGDGVPNGSDNSPDHPNPGQADSDGDGIGNASDLCPGLNSTNNQDTDRDGVGDPCDSDLDGDGVPNASDNCPNVANTSQIDTDSDGAGFACDADEMGQFAGPNVLLEVSLHFLENLSLIIPFPICPMCEEGPLPLDFLTQVTVEMPDGIGVRISDSNGLAVATAFENAGSQVLEVHPPPFAGGPFPFPLAGSGQGGTLADPAPDEIRYYLELYAGEGVSLNETYTVTLAINPQVPTSLFLPVVVR
jgi:Zn-dependent metalloprotease